MANVFHKGYSPYFQTIQQVTAEVDQLQQGWVLLKVVEVTYKEWIAVFVRNESGPISGPISGPGSGHSHDHADHSEGTWCGQW